MKRYLRDYVVLALIAGAVVALDQISKFYIRSLIPVGGMWSPWEWLTPYARIVHWYNTGVAFGMFQGMGQIFTWVNLGVSLVIIYYFPKVSAEDWPLRLAMGLQLGGAVGNLIDRVMIGHVTDFISIGNFPVFNVADSSITVGVAVLIVGIWLQDRKQKKDGQAKDEEPGEDEQVTP